MAIATSPQAPPSNPVAQAALVSISKHEQEGYILRLNLKPCARPNLVCQPALYCCAASGTFLREAVQKLEPNEPELRVWTSWKALRLLWHAGQHQQATDTLIVAMQLCNPGNKWEPQYGRSYNTDGALKHWELMFRGLVVLPEEFGTVRTTGNLQLNGNQIGSLPESFGNVTVGGNLSLNGNKFGSLLESFGNVTVGGDLLLGGNQIGSFPESFGNITVGGDLWLKAHWGDRYSGDMGPATAEASALEYPNAKVRK